VESADQICETAACVQEAGAVALRGGAFKARTSPYSFGGLGNKGLEYLALAREKTGLPVVTEVLDTQDLDLVARFADVLQIGSRNMQNYPLLFQAGSHPSGKPVLLKRGFAATIEEFLQAAQYVLLGRVSMGRKEPGLILCERGIRTACDATRFTLDVGALAVLKEQTALPVMADPSHAAGDRRYVAPLALAAAAAGADGLLMEVHPEPDRAWSDGAQSMDLRTFAALMTDLRRVAALRIEKSAQPCL
jgi:3-deoxy-7-phosphoheptulonate synthase